MDFSEIKHFWEVQYSGARKTGPQFQRAIAKRDLSLLAEFAAGAWLAFQGLELQLSELAGERVMSPRRRDRSKTCDFAAVAANGEKASPTFVEVKNLVCADSSERPQIKQFLQSAHLKGARWLIVLLSAPDLAQPAQLQAEELPKEAWQDHATPKQILKYRRNGLVKVTWLTLS